jgi:para-aminobenzoate synthetase component 1
MPKYKLPDQLSLKDFKMKLLAWSSGYQQVMYLDNNEHKNIVYHRYESVLGVGFTSNEKDKVIFSDLDQINNYVKDLESKKWLLGYISYDFKNEIYGLSSNNQNYIGLPLINFFAAEHLVIIHEDFKTIEILSDKADNIWIELLEKDFYELSQNKSFDLTPRFSRDEYIHTVENIKTRIVDGDVYEINFCQEFYNENVHIDPLSVFLRLNKINPAPYASFYRFGDHYLMCSSPERFIFKEGNKIVSEPIKGTTRRGVDQDEDEILKYYLANSEKEKAENVMIVDLVRNDFSKCSKVGSVKVEELFGIYSFTHVHQMISRITAELDEHVKFKEIMESTFPMGSMTGAPKLMSMMIIDQIEKNQRGLFSGSVGYINSNGDFDFNVVIRSILYNKKTNYLSVQVGSAIVFDSDAEKEYEECLLKARAMKMALGISVD